MRPSLLLPLLLAPVIASAEDDLKPIFNGKDLTGWVNVNCAPETWTAKDGILACTGAPIGALRTERQYENFVFECEWRHLKSGGNAGIFVWASPIAWPGVPFLRAIEVQVLDHGYGKSDWFTTHGDVFPIHGSKMIPFGRHNGDRSFPSEERSKGSPEWNHYRIEAKDGVLRLSVNGKEVSGGEKCNWRKGYLALESEGAPVEWRNLRLKELPSSAASADETAPQAEGHRALYNGVDLRGWKTESPDRWKVKDWQLSLTPGESGKPLTTIDEFADCEFIFDLRLPKDAAAGTNAQVLVRGVPIIVKGEPGKWIRHYLTVKGGIATHRVGESQTTIDLSKAPTKGPLALGDAGGQAAEFANIYVRDL